MSAASDTMQTYGSCPYVLPQQTLPEFRAPVQSGMGNTLKFTVQGLDFLRPNFLQRGARRIPDVLTVTNAELIASAAYRLASLHRPEPWIEDALLEIEELDQEIEENGYPKIHNTSKQEARRIVSRLAYQRTAPTIYPSEDGEVVIHFKSPTTFSAVLIELDNNGPGAACFSYVRGKSRRARYDDSADLPDEFINTQLREMAMEGSIS